MALETVLARSAWFSSQSAEIRAALIDEGRTIRLQPNQWVHSEGDSESGIYGVLEGALRVEAAIGPDRSVLLNMAGAGDFLGQARDFGGGRRIVTARASGQAAVLALSDASLARIARTQPDIWRAVSALVYAQLNSMVHLAAVLLDLPPRARIAARLLALPTDDTATWMTQADLAEMCGLSRKTANVHLRTLADSGLIHIGYGRMRVLSRTELQKIAGM